MSNDEHWKNVWQPTLKKCLEEGKYFNSFFYVGINNILSNNCFYSSQKRKYQNPFVYEQSIGKADEMLLERFIHGNVDYIV